MMGERGVMPQKDGAATDMRKSDVNWYTKNKSSAFKYDIKHGTKMKHNETKPWNI